MNFSPTNLSRTLFVLSISLFACLSTAWTSTPMKKHIIEQGFMRNAGQIVDQTGAPNTDVLFQHRGKSIATQLRRTGFSYDVYQVSKGEPFGTYAPKHMRDRHRRNTTAYRVDVDFVGSNSDVRIVPVEQIDGERRFLRHGSTFISHVYRSVVYENVYNGIDFVFHQRDDGTLEYDIKVAPGADLSAVRLKYRGARDVTVNGSAIEIETPIGRFVETLPLSYLSETRTPVSVAPYKNGDEIRFRAENYDRARTLVVDPVPIVLWSTYFGGSDLDAIMDVVVNPNDGDCVVGFTTSPNNIATVGAHQSTWADSADVFVARFIPDGRLQWATYFGGEDDDWPGGIDVDAIGNIYVAGITESFTGIAGPISYQRQNAGMADGFVAKFDPDGELQWSTYFGGFDSDGFFDLEIAPNGDVVCVGFSCSDGLATSGAYQEFIYGGCDGLIVYFYPGDGSLVECTYLGGDAGDFIRAVTIHSKGYLFLAGETVSGQALSSQGAYQEFIGGGQDLFLSRMDSFSNRVWTTYVGGDGDEALYGHSLDLGVDGALYLGFTTYAPNAISTSGTFQQALAGDGDGALMRFSTDGMRVWGTYIGGADYDEVACVYATSSTDILVVGTTVTSSNLATPGGINDVLQGGTDGLLMKFDNTGNRIWGTFIGGSSDDFLLSVAEIDAITYAVVGETWSDAGVVDVTGHQDMIGGRADGLLLEIRECEPPSPQVSGNSMVCEGITEGYVVVNPVPDHMYEWFDVQLGSINGRNDTSNVVIDWMQAGVDTVRVLVTEPFGCSTLREFIVIVSAKPQPVITGAASVCLTGQTIQQYTSGITDTTVTIEWSSIDLGTALTPVWQPTIRIDWQMRGVDTIQVKAAAGGNCSAIAEYIVSIQDSLAPTITSTNGDDFMCDGDFLTLDAGAGYDTYLWSTGDTTRTIDTWNAGDYTVTVTNGSCSGTSAPFTVTIIAYPVISISGPAVVCLTSPSATYSITTDASNTILWQDVVLGQVQQPTTDPTVEIIWNTTGTDTVRVGVLTPEGCFVEQWYEVVIADELIASVSSDKGTVLCEGDSMTLSTDAGMDTYAWLHDGTVVGSSRTLTVTLPGVYQVVITSGPCEDSSATFLVTVEPKPTVTITEDKGDLVAGGDPVDSYQWLNGQMQPIVGATSQRYTPPGDGTYYVRVTRGPCTVLSAPYQHQSFTPTDLFTVSDVNFGSLPVNDVINASGGHVSEFIVVNTSSQNLSLDSALVDGTGFGIPDQFPRLLRPGDTSRITIRFAPTEYISYRSRIAVYFASEIGIATASGTGRPLGADERITEVVLQPERIEVAPGDTVVVILAISAELPTATTASEYEATMQWDSRVLQLISTPEVFFRTTGREDNYFTAKIPEGYRTIGQKELVRIPFRAKLADVDSTVLVFSGVTAFRWKDDTKAYPACRDSVVHVRICREGGDRLITKRGMATINGVAPHPTGDVATIVYNVTMPMNIVIQIIDPMGVVVSERHVSHAASGTASVNVNLSGFSAGSYIVRILDGFHGASQLFIKQ